MDLRTRQTLRTNYQENQIARCKGVLGKSSITQTQGRRPILGDIQNVSLVAPSLVGKLATELEKKSVIEPRPITRSYKNILPKVNTGLSSLSLFPTARPPIRSDRDENTATKTTIQNGRNVKLVKTQSKENVPPANMKADDSLTKPLKGEVRIVRKTFVEPLKPRNQVFKSQSSEQQFNRVEKIQEPAKQKCEIPKPKVSVHEAYSTKMLSEVEDIDVSNESNPQLVSIYIKEIYKYLNELEIKYRIRPDHLCNQEVITGKMRALLIDWLIEVHVQFSLLPETFQLSIGIIDRYLQVVNTVKRNDIQLVGVTAVFLASKYEEIYAPDISDFVYVSDNAYKKNDIFNCEKKMLQTLNFSLGAPIPLHFLRRFVKAANGQASHHIIAKYFIDLCLVEYNMCRYLPSEIAAGALLLSLGLLSKEAFTCKTTPEEILKKCWSPTLQFYTKYHFERILPISMKIALLVKNVESSKYKGVYKKYLNTKYGKASTKPELKLPFVSLLAKPMESF